MKKLSLFLSMVIVGTSIHAQSKWVSDNAHSKVGFGITHLMISEVEGSFGEFDITATASDDFDNATFVVNIKVASIDTDNSNRDNHLKSSDFFAAEEHPSITFKSTNFERTGDKTFKVGGDLNMHGVTKKVTLDGKINGIITDQRTQKLKVGLKLTGSVNRLEFGVGGNTPTLGEEVDIEINLELAQQ
jgi:polyisoprenoid-binding protein YceI